MLHWSTDAAWWVLLVAWQNRTFFKQGSEFSRSAWFAEAAKLTSHWAGICPGVALLLSPFWRSTLRNQGKSAFWGCQGEEGHGNLESEFTLCYRKHFRAEASMELSIFVVALHSVSKYFGLCSRLIVLPFQSCRRITAPAIFIMICVLYAPLKYLSTEGTVSFCYTDTHKQISGQSLSQEIKITGHLALQKLKGNYWAWEVLEEVPSFCVTGLCRGV